MPPSRDFLAAMARCPLVAILRGVTPGEVEAIGGRLIDVGFSMIEVPLDSADALKSIEVLARRFGESALIGAGTVTSAAQVTGVRNAGGRIVVSPNTDLAVIAASVAAGMISLPGYSTLTEAFAALAAGASGLKLFPADAVGPTTIRAHRTVLPADSIVLAVGGITPDTMGAWRACGADGFGLGSALYAAGRPASEVADRARAFVAALG